jgi:hypothetical protein
LTMWYHYPKVKQQKKTLLRKRSWASSWHVAFFQCMTILVLASLCLLQVTAL